MPASNLRRAVEIIGGLGVILGGGLLVACRAPRAPLRDAAFVAEEVPGVMNAGESYVVSVTVENRGTTTWTRAERYRLGAQNPPDNWTWLPRGRASLDRSDSVRPGERKIFRFTVTAPGEPGAHDFQWRMVQDGVEWFGEQTANRAVWVQTSAGEAEIIDTLDYFVSKQPSRALLGSHGLSHTLSGRDYYTVKWSPDSFELHSWDDEYVYLREDHSGSPVDFYSFTSGLWMKRRMRVGETLVSSANRIQWYDRSCRPGRSTRYTFQTTLEAHRRDFDAGGDLGRQDVIVLRYGDPGGSGYEKFFYSRQWGWIAWEQYGRDGTLQREARFNRLGPAPVAPGRACSAR